MKLLCIDNKPIVINNYIGMGTGLIEGEIYETKGKSFIRKDGNLCYYIEGLGARMVCRFTELLDEKYKEDIAIEKLKEEFKLI